MLIKKLDWWLLGSVAVLLVLSLAILYSLGTTKTENLTWFYRQAVWIVVGLAGCIFLSLMDFRGFSTSPFIILILYFFVIVLLISVLVFGKTISGNRAWFAIGPFTFQPVEFAKLVLILFLAGYFSEKNIEIWRIRHIFISGAALFGILGLVLLQPDWGSGLVLAGIWFLMLLVSGARTKQVLLIILSFIILVLISWQWFFTENQQQRITGFLFPQQDPYGVSYSQRQALIALGSGGLWGKGLGRGTQTQLGFLPASRTDFIFSSIGEELGFLGVSAVLVSLGIIFWRLILLGLSGMNNYVKLFSLGYLAWLFVETVIHLGMNLGFLPVIGIGLPFVSYGGSHLLALFIGLGIINSIQIYGK
ncbi:MAG: FtsW/RodA/SpoVE family cell cycle protein [Patescibacteria group bacterium]